MGDWPMTYTWDGKPASELTHEEKDEAILYLLRERDRMWGAEKKRNWFLRDPLPSLTYRQTMEGNR